MKVMCYKGCYSRTGQWRAEVGSGKGKQTYGSLSKDVAQLSHLALMQPLHHQHDLDQFSLWPCASAALSEMGALVVLTIWGTLKL